MGREGKGSRYKTYVFFFEGVRSYVNVYIYIYIYTYKHKSSCSCENDDLIAYKVIFFFFNVV